MDERHGAMSLVVSLAAVLCACMPAYDESDEALEFRDDDGGVLAPGGRPSGGTWINNGLQAPNVGGIDPAYGLDTPQGMSETVGVLADVDLRGTAEYLVECALPLGEVVTKTVGSEVLEFHGLLGLAPEWADGACDEDCQQWVSACLLARTNASGETVTLWLRADHPAIGFEGPEDLIYEAGWYGNLFTDLEEQYLCKGAPNGPAKAKHEGRTCSQGGACGFTKYGKCSKHDRCVMTGPDDDVPADCTAEGAVTYHTIATYIED